MQSAREQCVTKGNQPFIFIKDPMRPTRGFNSERANPFRDHFRAWKQSQKSQETKEIIILVNQYKNGWTDDASCMDR